MREMILKNKEEKKAAAVGDMVNGTTMIDMITAATSQRTTMI
jgi:hypothetical protein